MLASVLPGLRDLRGPLAAGYLWVLALYLAFEPIVPGRKRATGVWLTLTHLHHSVSVVGTGVALSFLAYLLGAVSQALFAPAVLAKLVPKSVAHWALGHRAAEPPMKPGRFLWLRRLIFITPEPGEPPSRLPFGDAGSLALGQIVEERKVSLENALEQAGHGTWSLTDFTYRRKDVPSSAEPAIRPISDLIYGGHFPTSLTERIVDELHLARASLLGEHPEIFAEIDRLSSEGEFRRQVSAPLLALGVVLTVRSLWWLGLIMWAATGILVVSGRAQSRRSNESLVDAIRLGRARTPSLDRVDESIKAIRTSEGGAAAPASNTETGLVPQASSSVAAVSEKAVLQPELSLAESARSSEKAGETSGETDVGDIAVMNETSDRNEAGERRDGRLGF